MTLDSNPRDDYLNDPHILEIGNKKWSRKTAKKAHEMGIEYSVQLWDERDEYNLATGIDIADVIGTIIQMTDVLYAQHLETPAQWTAKTWTEFGSWLKENQTKAEYDRTSKLLVAFMTLLANEKVLSESVAKQIISVLQGKVISLDEKRKHKN